MNADEEKWLRGALAKAQFFSTVSPENIDHVLKSFHKRAIPADRVIIEEGAPGEALYAIFKGRAKVLKRKMFIFAERVAELGEGSFFGEMSLVLDKPASATIIAQEDSELFVLLKRDFQTILKDNPHLNTEIQHIAERCQFDSNG